MGDRFSAFATKASYAAGHYLAFCLAVLIILGWAVTGPLFGFSDTWQLFINTFTTLVTFLMVFLIQNTQNRSAVASQIKEDALIAATPGADNRLIPIEHASEAELRAALAKLEAEAETIERAE
jgi:low affinity Fe/Cu permease